MTRCKRVSPNISDRRHKRRAIFVVLQNRDGKYSGQSRSRNRRCLSTALLLCTRYNNNGIDTRAKTGLQTRLGPKSSRRHCVNVHDGKAREKKNDGRFPPTHNTPRQWQRTLGSRQRTRDHTTKRIVVTGDNDAVENKNIPKLSRSRGDLPIHGGGPFRFVRRCILTSSSWLTRMTAGPVIVAAAAAVESKKEKKNPHVKRNIGPGDGELGKTGKKKKKREKKHLRWTMIGVRRRVPL